MFGVRCGAFRWADAPPHIQLEGRPKIAGLLVSLLRSLGRVGMTNRDLP